MVEGTMALSRWHGLPFYARTNIVALLIYALVFELAGALLARIHRRTRMDGVRKAEGG